MENEIVLGCTVQDRISGFIGVVTGLVYYVTGCNQALVQPRSKPDGDYIQSQWFDLERLDRCGNEVIKLRDGNPGFDKPAPRR